jgi:Flp pilus assembly protein TadD
VKNHPRSAEGHLALAKGLLASGELTRAEAELTRLVKSQPNAAVVHAQIGLLRLAKSDSPGAKRSFDRALELDPSHVQAMAGLVALDVTNKQIGAARSKVEGWLAKSPGNAALHLLAARTYAMDRDLVRAEQSLRKVIEIDPAVLEAYSALGQIYMATNRLQEALQEFEEIAKRKPKSIGAHTLIATILQVQNRIPEAQERYRRVLALDARSPVAANNLAWIYAETGGNLDVAVDLALTARAGLPDHAAVSDTLGWIYYKKDRAQQAISPLRNSVAKEPQNPVYHFHLGLAYAKAGEGAKARVALEQALKLKPDFAGADEARRTLAAVKG